LPNPPHILCVAHIPPTHGGAAEYSGTVKLFGAATGAVKRTHVAAHGLQSL